MHSDEIVARAWVQTLVDAIADIWPQGGLECYEMAGDSTAVECYRCPVCNLEKVQSDAIDWLQGGT